MQSLNIISLYIIVLKYTLAPNMKRICCSFSEIKSVHQTNIWPSLARGVRKSGINPIVLSS